jgi:hypothetical protein
LFKDAKARFEEQHRAFRLLRQEFDLLAVEHHELPIDLAGYKSVLEPEVTELISCWRDLARLGVLDRFAARGQFRTEAQKILTRPRERPWRTERKYQCYTLSLWGGGGPDEYTAPFDT